MRREWRGRRVGRTAGGAFVLASVLGGTAAVAQRAPDAVTEGRTIAGQNCVTCHVVTPSGGAGWTDAPSFLTIANRNGAGAAKISADIQRIHLDMLHDQLPKHEADAVAAYIMSLRRR